MDDNLVIAIVLIGVAMLIIGAVSAVVYFQQLTNYNSIPIYDKACGLNYTQTWDNAWKYMFIDTDACKNVHLQQ